MQRGRPSGSARPETSGRRCTSAWRGPGLKTPERRADDSAAAGEDEDAYAKSIEASPRSPRIRRGPCRTPRCCGRCSVEGQEGDGLRLQAAVALLTVGEYARAEELLELISA